MYILRRASGGWVEGEQAWFEKDEALELGAVVLGLRHFYDADGRTRERREAKRKRRLGQVHLRGVGRCAGRVCVSLLGESIVSTDLLSLLDS